MLHRKIILTFLLSIVCGWSLMAGGKTDVKTFRFENSPIFFDYPVSFIEEAPQSDSELLRVVGEPNFKLPVIVANVYSSDIQSSLDSSGELISRMMEKTPGSKDFTVVSEGWVDLNGGLKAYKVTLNWLFSKDNVPMETVCLLVKHNDSLISLSGTATPLISPIAPIEDICMTLRSE